MHFAYYRAEYVARHQRCFPALRVIQDYFDIYGSLASPVDRSGVLRLPVRVKSLFPLPRMRILTKSYEHICNERAEELLKRAERLDVPLYAFWSGGVDSTCLLVSFLRVATKAQRQRLIVLMSEDSITEYPDFYRKYIRGHLCRESAQMFPYILGTKNLIVNGEHNDQLFGSDVLGDVAQKFGEDAIHKPYDRKLFTDFFASVPSFVVLFERLRDGAPIPLKSNFDMMWWMNFAVKWQAVFMRMLGYTAKTNADMLSESYVSGYYAPFFNTEDFQLWSMNNIDLRIKKNWRSYKWPAKEVIYKFTRDADYRDNKLKRGSLVFLIAQHVPFNFIDENFRFHENVSPEEFYEPGNDFL